MPSTRPMPSIAEALDELDSRLRHERNPVRKQRLHLLTLIKAKPSMTRQQAAAHLALHRNTVSRWLRLYDSGGLDLLLTLKPAGAPAQQRSLPPEVFEKLKERLRTPQGFRSYLDAQRWLKDEFDIEIPYKTLHKLIYYRLKAKLKRARPRHAKKTMP